LNLGDHIAQDRRSFGDLQSWSAGQDQRGIGGERLIADLLSTQVNARPGGSVVFLGLDLGRAGNPYPHLRKDTHHNIVGFGGDMDIALFLREYQEESSRYQSSRRGLKQDHLVLIDSKQYSEDWERSKQFEKAEKLLAWFRNALAHRDLLGSGNGVGSLRMSYHFAHTGKWVPDSWLRKVGGNGETQVSPNYQWWNTDEDLVFESPVEVLLGQLAVLLTFANPTYREWVPEALWQLLNPSDRQYYKSG
jgi:hypothetical protein